MPGGGDTNSTLLANPPPKRCPLCRRPKPMVFCGCSPTDAESNTPDLRESTQQVGKLPMRR